MFVQGKYQAYVEPAKPKYTKDPVKWFDNCIWPLEWSRTYSEVLPNSGSSKQWCEDRIEQRPKVSEIAIHMKLVAKSEGRHGLVAMNFQIPYRIAYIRTIDKILINPIVESVSMDTKDCLERSTQSSQVVRKTGRFTSLRVSYLDEHSFVRKEIDLSGAESCIIQSLLDDMLGMV